MAALTNLLGNGITRILGIRNLTYEDLEKFAGIKKENVKGIQYKEQGEKKEYKQPQSKSGQQTEAPPDAEGDLTVKEKLDKELREYCTDAKGLVDMNLYKSVLKEVSTWTDKEKKEHSFDEITEKISDKWAGSALGKLRDKIKVKDA